MKHTYSILLIIFTIGLIISSILTFMPVPNICSATGGCGSVLTSKYSALIGIKNSTVGIGIFLFMIFITLLHMKTPRKLTKRIIYTGTIIGSGISILFLYIQKFILNLYCKYCLVVDLAILLGPILIIIHKEK